MVSFPITDLNPSNMPNFSTTSWVRLAAEAAKMKVKINMIISSGFDDLWYTIQVVHLTCAYI